ncbi:hypothetical protein LOTGIDRAFT_234961 [Lottia gigantea]|uniref:Uncharacterized protein n=1 Tax=Lottia gigantea TaxID=225164 RepID=V3ZTK8_LOTGI|nr:hypothetical protein LOTGIDRAFT_234961 [Lottia gigantea]ESO87717.1 hypothetical protein LOTGIDRAFT_234961 [Lottia gigantea]
MAEAEPQNEPDVVREPYQQLAAIRHEYDALEKLAEDVQNDVKESQREVEEIEMENKWCHDEAGIRNRASASQEAERIITQTNNYPDLIQDIIGNLNQKKSELQATVADQEKKLKESSPPTESL